MSDPIDADDTSSEEEKPAFSAPPVFPAQGSGQTVTLRPAFPVGAFDSRVEGAPLITAEGTAVPASLVQSIRDAALAAGIELQEV